MKQRFIRGIAVASAVGLLSGVLAACSSSGSSSSGSGGDQVLKWGSSTQPASLDPRKSATFDPIFLTEVYDSLIRRAADGSLVPGLATKWTLSADAKSLDLVLRDGVKFQDGKPFDADAVKANIEKAQEPGFTTTSTLAIIDKVEVVDPTHVTLRMSSPAGYLVQVLAGEAGMMISPAALDNADLATKPVGTGPFRVTTYNQSKLVYEKWDGYWDAAAIKLDRIDMTFLLDEKARLRALSSGQVNAAPIRSNQNREAESDGMKLTKGDAAFVYGIMLNTKQSELGDPLVRQALIHAIDREAIDKAFFANECAPLVQPYPAGHWAHVDGLEKSPEGDYDPAKARDLLKQAGLADGFKLDMFMGTAPTFQSVAQALQAQLGKVGIKVKLTAMENTALATARRAGKFESSFASVQSGRPDPTQFVKDFYVKGGSFNPGGFELKGIDSLLKKTEATYDDDARKAPMQKIVTDVLAAGPPMIPVCSATVVWAHTDQVQGLEIAVNYDYDFRSVSIKN
jgi:ABC-type transport system substrate-binding protein